MRNITTAERFSTVRRGYDPEAVEMHLDALTSEHDTVLDEAAARIAALQSELAEVKSHEEAVHLTILAATRTKAEMLEAAEVQAEELKMQGRKEGDRIITEARMQAFQMLTEARTEAGEVVAEARAEAAAVARVEADASPSVDVVSEREQELQHRVEEMQAIIKAMEHEILSLASPPPPAQPMPAPHDTRPVTTVSDEVPIDDATESDAVAAPTPPPVATAASPPAYEEHIEIVVTESASDGSLVEPPPTGVAKEDRSPSASHPKADIDERSADDGPDDSSRRSFYSRRSAKLPRIGSEAGRDAMSAMAGLRSNFAATAAGEKPKATAEPKLEAV
jgi:cell division septum initiation protein DivIVA